MNIGPFIRELVAEPVSDPVPEVIPIEAPTPDRVDCRDEPVPAP